MSDTPATTVFLSLALPDNIVQDVEDFLLSRPDLVRGFTAIAADGHGTIVPLVAMEELVSGHSRRILIQTIGPRPAMEEMLALLKEKLPRANIYFWMIPVLAAGKL